MKETLSQVAVVSADGRIIPKLSSSNAVGVDCYRNSYCDLITFTGIGINRDCY